ncbi:MAG: hypothetical protein GC159_16635 [Phycisphaera sp.]|nr:hypothetical protein [Phycisphaera sp.]
MCGRYTQRHSGEQIAARFGVEQTLFEPRITYNAAPSQVIAAVTRDDDHRALRGLRWGLVPPWADDPAIGNRMINARGETAADKPAYRAAFRKRRCLIPADGFYEWRSNGKGKGKTPMLVEVDGGELFALAGLWERWTDKQTGETLDTCTVITTEPNATMRPIHDRMPVILRRGDEAAWLDPDTSPDDLAALLRPYDDEPMTAHAVSTHVNAPAHNDPRCIERVPDTHGEDDDGGLFSQHK